VKGGEWGARYVPRCHHGGGQALRPERIEGHLAAWGAWSLPGRQCLVHRCSGIFV